MIAYIIFFLCLYQANALITPYNEDDIYDIHGNLKDYLHGFYKGDLVIPCLPKTPDAVVKITSFREKDAQTYFEISSLTVFKRSKENYELDYSTYTYNPQIGFTFHRVRNMPLTILCYNSNPEFGNGVPFKFQITLTDQYKRHQPIIRSKTHGHVQEGKELELVCEVLTKNNMFDYNLFWNTTVENPNERYSYRTKCDKPGDKYCVTILKLYIENATKNDSRTYECIHDGLKGKDVVANYRITVLAPNEHYLELELPFVDTSNGTHVEVSYRGYPQPILYWETAKGDKIFNKQFIQYTSNKVIMSLKPAKNVGTRSLVLKASNGFDKRQLHFNQTSIIHSDTQIIMV